MERRAFGKTDMMVSVLGFGAAEIGFSNASEETVDRLLGTALDAGLNVIDTAECYNTSEELIGKTMSHRRDDFYLFTKCGHTSGLDGEDWNPAMLEESIDRSLKRLKTDYVDTIHLHSCSEDILRQGDVIDVLKRAKEKGKTRYIGYSGDHTDALYAIKTGAFDTFETSVSIADQEAVDLTIPEAVKRGMGIIAKRPIANVAWNYSEKPENGYYQEYWERFNELDYPFLKGELPEAVEKALRFTLTVPGVHTAIVGTAKPDRWIQNAKLAAKGNLSEKEYNQIRDLYNRAAKKEWAGQV
ncbi:aldo/keto reductase [Metabacillus indicus]|uniref:aldo/keto reductase n=1 Tax=Metabacillus indicus TaxID=246786 RepID=UPI00049353F5|nr:aldo/keto reductase [Metabacillus indicus]KEZ48566.1 aldo/keto reductase [Metabacillus indicus LMG 22858]